MNVDEIINTLEMLKAEIEWDKSLEYQIAIKQAIRLLSILKIKNGYIKDLTTGEIRQYGTSGHDSLRISDDGRYLSYENLQNGDGSLYGDYRFVVDDNGKIPADDEVLARYGADAYFEIGGKASYNLGYVDALTDGVSLLDTLDTYSDSDIGSLVLKEDVKKALDERRRGRE